MDTIATLPQLGEIMRAIYIPYGSASEPERIALGIASVFLAPVRVFHVQSDLVTPEEGRTLVGALTASSAVVLFGASHSKLLQALGHYWPDYVEYAAHSSMTIARNVELSPCRTPNALANIYLLFPELTPEHRSDRPGVLPLSAEDATAFASRAAASALTVESLGKVGLAVDGRISWKDLCLLHERDSKSTFRALNALLSGSDALSWTDLQTFLRHTPTDDILEYLRSRLTVEQYAYGLVAIDFLKESKRQRQRHLFPDIYAALWRLEHVFQPDTFFRGQFRCEWGLESTLLRPSKGEETLDVGELTQRAHLTTKFIEELKRREAELYGAMDDSSLLAIAQHFGLPTPLLDFTRSLKVAAFFATLEANELKSDDPAIGVIFYNSSPLERQLDLTDHPQGRGLHHLAGVRIGSLQVIEPNLPDADNRIGRQQGAFVAGYRARDLQAVSIDRIYFKQQPGVTFEDPRAGVTRARLLPENTALSMIAEEVKAEVKAKSSIAPILPNALLRRATISDTSVIGSVGAHLFWHLRFGQEFLGELRQHAQQIGAEPLSQALEAVVSQYFAMAHVEAGISNVPDHESEGLLLNPIRKAIIALEAAAGLPEDDLWRLLVKHLPRGFESGGSIHLDVPESWPESGRIALSCAMFCIAWEHLRQVPGLRAEELVQSATRYLYRW